MRECPTCGCEGWNGTTNCAIKERDACKRKCTRLAAEVERMKKFEAEARAAREVIDWALPVWREITAENQSPWTAMNAYAAARAAAEEESDVQPTPNP